MKAPDTTQAPLPTLTSIPEPRPAAKVILLLSVIPRNVIDWYSPLPPGFTNDPAPGENRYANIAEDPPSTLMLTVATLVPSLIVPADKYGTDDIVPEKRSAGAMNTTLPDTVLTLVTEFAEATPAYAEMMHVNVSDNASVFIDAPFDLNYLH
ncbi:TPA: hypothetical protein ACIBKG_004507 [Salmonella enterica subsp. enterica serovar Thompson]